MTNHNAGCPGEQSVVANTERLIIAGDSLSLSTRGRQEQVKAKYLTANAAAGSIAAVRQVLTSQNTNLYLPITLQLDDLLVQLVSNINIDLMPGPNDPANTVQPQQPLHRIMFSKAGLYPTLSCVTNPYSCSLAGRNILSVSGQTIADILRNSTLTVSYCSEYQVSTMIMSSCTEWDHFLASLIDAD